MRKVFNADIQRWFFNQLLAAYKDLAAHFSSSTLNSLLKSSQAIEVHLTRMNGGFDDCLIVVPSHPEIIHVVEKEGEVKAVSTMSRKAALQSCLFAERLNAFQLSMVESY